MQERTGWQLSCALVTWGCSYPGATPEQGHANNPRALFADRVWVKQACTVSMSCTLRHPALSSGIQVLVLGATMCCFIQISPLLLVFVYTPSAVKGCGTPTGSQILVETAMTPLP